MPNHWHLVLWAIGNEVPAFMHWLTLTHAMRWHAAHGTAGTGHVYQSRYRAIPVQAETHLYSLLRYVERNALRAHLVEQAEQWRWSSLWRRCNSCEDGIVSEWPIPHPKNWIELVNSPQTEAELKAIQEAVHKNRPLGEPGWTESQRVQLPKRRGAGRPPNRDPV